MIPESLISLYHRIAHLPGLLALIQIIASIVLIRAVDWHTKVQASRWEAAIRELEELFALPDLRESRGSGSAQDRSPAPRG